MMVGSGKLGAPTIPESLRASWAAAASAATAAWLGAAMLLLRCVLDAEKLGGQSRE